MQLAIDTAQSFDLPNNGGGDTLLQTDTVQPGANLQIINQVDQIVSLAANYNYSGQIVDSTNEQPIPFASIVIYDANGNQISGQSADANGNFNIAANNEANSIEVSASGYTTFIFPASQYQHLFELERSGELPGVTITTQKSDSTWLIALIVIAFIVSQKKKGKVGKLDRNDIVTYVLIAVAILGLSFINTNIFDTIHNLLVSLGLGKGAGQTQTENELTNPYSPWKPQYWQAAPAGSLLLTNEVADQYAHDIFYAMAPLNDDYETILGIFRQLRTQSQVSYLADRFFQYDFTPSGYPDRQGLDLLTYLQSGNWTTLQFPGDGLSDSHLKVLTDMVTNLPKYTA